MSRLDVRLSLLRLHTPTTPPGRIALACRSCGKEFPCRWHLFFVNKALGR